MKRRHFFRELSAGLACMSTSMLDTYAEEMNNALAEAREELPENPEVMGYPTIQEAIDAAEEGSTVILEDGVYHQGFDYKGKAVTITSRSGPENCVIDMDHNYDKRIRFTNNETSASVIDGLTLTNGSIIGSIIYCKASTPIISNNIITQSYGYAFLGTGSCNPVIKNNIISNITEDANNAIRIEGSSQIVGNIIFNNTFGITCVGGYSRIINNTIVGNKARSVGWDSDSTGDVGAINGSSCTLEITNTIVRDNGYDYWFKTGPTGEFEAGFRKANIKLSGSKATISYCNIDTDTEGILVSSSTLEWGDGNIDTDPLFVDEEGHDFHLREESPCKNAGQNGFDIGAYTNDDTIITGVGTNKPSHISLDSFPNPFNQTATIVYTLPQPSKVRLAVYTVNGQCVRTFLDGFCPAGRHTIAWNAVDMPSGVYICSLEAGGHITTRKMLLLK